MTLRRVAPVTLVAALALAAGPSPAHAAQYNIRVPKPLVGDSDVWRLDHCPTEYVTSPANGVDSLVVDVSSKQGQSLAISWTATYIHSTATLQGLFVTASCGDVGVAATSGPVPGTWAVQVPQGAKWMVINNFYMVNVQLSL